MKYVVIFPKVALPYPKSTPILAVKRLVKTISSSPSLFKSPRVTKFGSSSPVEISILLGDGNGAFAPQKTFSTGSGSVPISIVFGDLNNDNQSDIVVANSLTNNLGVFLVHYEADFTQTMSYSTGSSPHPYSVVVANFNNDNRLDMAVVNSGNDNLEVFLDYNQRTFTSTTTYSMYSNSHPQHVIVADLNNDNRLDIATVNHWNDSLSVFVGFGNGTFHTATAISSTWSLFKS